MDGTRGVNSRPAMPSMRPAVSIRDRQCHRCDPRCQFGIGEWIDAFREVNFESGEWIDAFRELNLGPANGSMRSAKSIWVRRMDRCDPRSQFGFGEWTRSPPACLLGRRPCRTG